MARRAFITGITGQDGAYLSKLLLDKGYEVHGLLRRSASADVVDSRLKWIGVADQIILHDANSSVSYHSTYRQREPRLNALEIQVRISAARQLHRAAL